MDPNSDDEDGYVDFEAHMPIVDDVIAAPGGEQDDAPAPAKYHEKGEFISGAMVYPETHLYIDGNWVAAPSRPKQSCTNLNHSWNLLHPDKDGGWNDFKRKAGDKYVDMKKDNGNKKTITKKQREAEPSSATPEGIAVQQRYNEEVAKFAASLAFFEKNCPNKNKIHHYEVAKKKAKAEAAKAEGGKGGAGKGKKRTAEQQKVLSVANCQACDLVYEPRKSVANEFCLKAIKFFTSMQEEYMRETPRLVVVEDGMTGVRKKQRVVAEEKAEEVKPAN